VYYGIKENIMRIIKLEDGQKQEGLNLALQVFMEFEAPDYNAEGIANFREFVTNIEKTDGLVMYGAFKGDTLVGMGATRNGGRHISLLFVDSDFQGQGIGKQLIRAMLRKCPECIITVNSSPFAVEIYKKMGFEATNHELLKDGIRYTPMQCASQKHLGTVPIETERLLLRRFTIDDTPAMFENWAKDPDVTKFLTWPPHQSVAESEIVLTEWMPLYENPNYYHWAISLKGDPGVPIGSIGAVRLDDVLNQAHIGYCIGKAWWNRGITSEALASLIRFFFVQVGLNRVDSRHDPNNPNSGKVMQKCGMQYEGTHRQADVSNRGICDSAWYGILAEDYFDLNED
jgi:[ribosomal protein S5]-alanine N-acetyltransferase